MGRNKMNMHSHRFAYMLVIACACWALLVPNTLASAEQGAKAGKSLEGAINTETPENSNYMRLGTPGGAMGGEDMLAYDRNKIKDQILTFIPPLLRPAFVQHAFVLPPKVYSVSIAEKFASLDGEDYNNDAVFKDAKLERRFTDFNFLYGFDLGHKYLHSFTVKLNIPYKSAAVDGSVHPHGQQFIDIENAGGYSNEIGDVSIFVKKKILEQGNWPIGLAMVFGASLPTGNNHAKFGSNGRVTARRPAAYIPGVDTANGDTPATNTTLRDNLPFLAGGFDKYMGNIYGGGADVTKGCFFKNVNSSMGCAKAPFGIPAARVNSFAPGGSNAANQFIGDFPFNNGVFGRFGSDGRLPAPLQPGTGSASYTFGLFATRQFEPGAFPGRSALHIGVADKLVLKTDGVDLGDTITYFASYVRPIYKDFVAVDLAFVAKDHQNDSYDGQIPIPGVHKCVDGETFLTPKGPGKCGAGGKPVGTEIFGFNKMDRPSFSGGTTAFFAPSLIFSPDPQLRMTFSTIIRVQKPDLGPSPPLVFRASLEANF